MNLNFRLLTRREATLTKPLRVVFFDYFSNRGFKRAEDEGYFFENAHGDVISFDNSYNNFEFSLCYGNNLCEIKKRFDEYFAEAQNYFSRENYELIGRGTNPNKKHNFAKQSRIFPHTIWWTIFLENLRKKTQKFPDFSGISLVGADASRR
ncbi:MAG: hypothetical protein L6V93_18630 [Clostridiales bacterium]|nr:MAG: hypothetical protein L6V93_18630 [Clostridiales bacterium]